MELPIDTMESNRDHIHILVDIPPKLSAFQLVHPLKQIATFRIYKRHKSKVAYISQPKGVGVLRSSNKINLLYAAIFSQPESLYDQNGRS
jgi:REP element-mobilizing transposase RayT